jgi:hypothetical protein
MPSQVVQMLAEYVKQPAVIHRHLLLSISFQRGGRPSGAAAETAAGGKPYMPEIIETRGV